MTDQTGQPRAPRTPRARVRRERYVAAAALLLVACLIGGWLLLPAVLQLLPPRYIARLPEPLQALAARPHPEYLPTPALTAPPLPPTPPPTRTLSATATALAPTDTPRSEPTYTASATATPTPPPPAATPIPSVTLPATTRRFSQCAVQVGRGRFADLTQATVLLDSPTLQYICQTWNNCGPATLAMNLSYWGWSGTQLEIAGVIRPDPEDKHTSAAQIAQYAQSQGFGAIVRIGGTIERLKAFLDAGFPVLMSRGYEQVGENEGWLGHYGLVIGYSEPLQEFILMDSLLGPDQAISYDEFDFFWAHFNHRYIPIYPPERADQVRAILGEDLDDTAMYQSALARAQARAQAAPDDPFAWNAVGANLVGLGDAANASIAYDRARVAGLPWRVLWYQFDIYEAYLAVGRYDDVIALTDAVLQVTPYVEETYYYKGRALQAKGDIEGARALYQTALVHNPGYTLAADALAGLP